MPCESIVTKRISELSKQSQAQNRRDDEKLQNIVTSYKNYNSARNERERHHVDALTRAKVFHFSSSNR